ncbi:MAG: PilZ domain-containing protein [Gammaproteobacteria bacterium]
MTDDRHSPPPGITNPRRLHPRAEVRLAAALSGSDVGDLPVLIHNVSRDGMLVVFAEPLDASSLCVGRRVRIIVSPDTHGGPASIAVTAQVRWLFAYGVGVKVAEADAAAMNDLRAASAERLKAVSLAAPSPAPGRKDD